MGTVEEREEIMLAFLIREVTDGAREGKRAGVRTLPDISNISSYIGEKELEGAGGALLTTGIRYPFSRKSPQQEKG